MGVIVANLRFQVKFSLPTRLENHDTDLAYFFEDRKNSEIKPPLKKSFCILVNFPLTINNNTLGL